MWAPNGHGREFRWQRRNCWLPLVSLWGAGGSLGLMGCSTPRQALGGEEPPDAPLIRRAQSLANKGVLGLLPGCLSSDEAQVIKVRSQARYSWRISQLMSHPSTISITLFTLVKGDWSPAHTYLEVEAQGWGGGELGGMYGPLASLQKRRS